MPRSSRRATMASHVPMVSEPKVKHRSPSPLSPTKISRLEEKKEMTNLNDRLATYIERFRSQEMEINSLHRHMSSIETDSVSELESVKNAFSSQLSNLRKALDNESSERAKFEIEAQRYMKDYSDVEKKLRDAEINNDLLTDERRKLQNEVHSLRQHTNKVDAEVSTLKPNLKSMMKKLEEAQKALKEETLARVALQNEFQTKEESLKFEKELLENHLNDSKVRRQIDMSDIDNKLQRQYDEKLQASLMEFRETYQHQISESRNEFVSLYENKVKTLQSQWEKSVRDCAERQQELEDANGTIIKLKAKVDELKTVNEKLNAKCKHDRTEMAKKEADVKLKDDQINSMLEEYRDLMEVKVSLDLEIAAYRKMLESEEARLGIVGGKDDDVDGGQHGLGSPTRKRRRVDAFNGQSSPFDRLSSGLREKSVIKVVTAHTSVWASSHELAKEGGDEVQQDDDVVDSNENGREHVDFEGLPLEIDVLEYNGNGIRVRNVLSKTSPSMEENGANGQSAEIDENASVIQLGGFTLNNMTGGEMTTYKFPKATKLEPGEVCTVWNSGQDMEHDPPLNLVMKRGTWDIGCDNTTTLVDKSGNEIACRTTRFERTITTRTQLEHDKSCLIM